MARARRPTRIHSAANNARAFFVGNGYPAAGLDGAQAALAAHRWLARALPAGSRTQWVLNADISPTAATMRRSPQSGTRIHAFFRVVGSDLENRA